MDPSSQAKATFEEMKVKSNQLVDHVRDIMESGNARRITIRREGRTLLEFPLALGVGGTAAAILMAPTLAAVGAIAALVADVSVVVERAPAKSTDVTPPQEPTR